MDLEKITQDEFEVVLDENVSASEERTRMLRHVKQLRGYNLHHHKDSVEFFYDRDNDLYVMRARGMKTTFKPDSPKETWKESYIRYQNENPHAR